MNDPLKDLTWSDNFAKPRSARSSIIDMSDEDKEEISDVKNNLNFTESDGESDKDLLVQSVATH